MSLVIKTSNIAATEENLLGTFGYDHEESNDLTFGFYVISLQGVNGSHAENSGRLDEFLKHWRETCGGGGGDAAGSGIDFTVCPGTTDTRRGFGITRSFVNCFGRAIEANVSMGFFFEDDARLLNNNASFCHPPFREALYGDLPDDLYLLLLGGHQWNVHPVQNHVSWNRGFVHLNHSFGAFGFAVPDANLVHLRDAFRHSLEYRGPAINPDRDWYAYAEAANKTNYAANPLVVGHPPGWSNTWKMRRAGVGSFPGW